MDLEEVYEGRAVTLPVSRTMTESAGRTVESLWLYIARPIPNTLLLCVGRDIYSELRDLVATVQRGNIGYSALAVESSISDHLNQASLDAYSVGIGFNGGTQQNLGHSATPPPRVLDSKYNQTAEK